MRYPSCALGGLGISLLLAACGSSPQVVQPGQSSAVASPSSSVVDVDPFTDITVTVTDRDYDPISNAVVSAVGTSVTAQSDSAGHAYLMGLSLGEYKVRVHANGYYPDVTQTRPGRGNDVYFRLDWAPPIGVFTFKDSAYLIWVVLAVHQDLSLEAGQIWWDCGDRQWHQRTKPGSIAVGQPKFSFGFGSSVPDSYGAYFILAGPGQLGRVTVGSGYLAVCN